MFGEVVEGMDVVRKIGKVPVGAADRPVKDVRITAVTIEKK
ncbi:MAG: peptidylprolyl isomerase [Vicinamibacterales bacterium]|nr:peptidylprolyl isomerase [Vicinamibacterales bacterium]